MSDIKINLINYLDKNAVVENRRVSPFNLQKLIEEFPDIDKLSLIV